MKKYSMIFFIKQSLSGLFMNAMMSLTSALILTSCLILMGCFGFFIYNVNINLDQLDELNKIVFFIDKAYDSEEEIERIKNEIQALNNVAQIRVISRQEALDQTIEEISGKNPEFNIFEDEDFYEGLNRDNPMPDAIEIEYIDINYISTLIFQLAGIEGHDKIRNSAEIAEFITDLKNVVQLVLVWFLLVLFGIAIFIILNTVKLSVHSRKSEIVIMRYIGATNFFILFPFLLEGVIIGIVSAIIAYWIQWYIYGAAAGTLIEMDTGLKFVDFSEISVAVFVIFVLVGVLCGLLGSSISSNKHLKA
jgi:cell division transport system permease protein